MRGQIHLVGSHIQMICIGNVNDRQSDRHIDWGRGWEGVPSERHWVSREGESAIVLNKKGHRHGLDGNEEGWASS